MPTTSTTVAALNLSGYIGAIALFQYLNIPQEQIFILAILMLLDFAAGVAKQFRIDPRKITSARAWLGLIKKVGTLIVVLTVALVLKGIDVNGTTYITSILGIFIMAEGYSIIQNIYTIRTGESVPEFDVVSIVIKKIGDELHKRICGVLKIPKE